MKKIDKDYAEDVDADIEVNEILQVCVADDENSATYHSRVNDVSQGKLIIAWPTHGGIRLLVHRDQILIFHFLRDNVPHEFTGMVDDMDSSGFPQLAIIVSSAITRIQRRQNFRIKCMLPVEITSSLEGQEDHSVTAVSIRTTTCDISASGLGIRHSKPIPENSLVEVKLGLPDDAPEIRVPCRVVYAIGPGEHQSLCRMGLRILAISESDRARIVRYVYRSQLKGIHP